MLHWTTSHTNRTVAFQEDQSFQQRVGHACSIWTHEQSTLKRNTSLLLDPGRLEPVFPSYVNHGPYHCTTSLLWLNDSTKDLKFKVRTKNCNFVFKDNQGPRPRTTSLLFPNVTLAIMLVCHWDWHKGPQTYTNAERQRFGDFHAYSGLLVELLMHGP